MNKTEFLTQAKEKIANHNKGVTNGVDWISEMNFIFNEHLILRVWAEVDSTITPTVYSQRMKKF
jgi:hypothetical protein